LQAFSSVAVEVTDDKVLRCDCGFEVRADDEAELVAQVQRHALSAHAMQFSSEEVLQLAFRAELGDTSWLNRLDDESHQEG
jgi:predicted small metal-binding protein